MTVIRIASNASRARRLARDRCYDARARHDGARGRHRRAGAATWPDMPGGPLRRGLPRPGGRAPPHQFNEHAQPTGDGSIEILVARIDA